MGGNNTNIPPINPNQSFDWIAYLANASPGSSSTQSSHTSPVTASPNMQQFQAFWASQMAGQSSQFPQQPQGEPEVTVPETQQIPNEEEIGSSSDTSDDEHNRKRRKGKAKKKPKTNVYWTADEELKLVECWVAISEDRVTGRDQNSRAFWGRVRNLFNPNYPKERKRSRDQCSGKWRTLAGDVKRFIGHYAMAKRTKPSGESDLWIENSAREWFYAEQGKHFKHTKAWSILKDVRAFKDWMAKNENNGTNENIVILGDDVNDNDPEPRPPGRPRASKIARSNSASDASSKSIRDELFDHLDRIAAPTNEFIAKKSEAYARIAEASLVDADLKAFQFLQMSTDGFTPEEAAALEAKKRVYREKLGIPQPRDP